MAVLDIGSHAQITTVGPDRHSGHSNNESANLCYVLGRVRTIPSLASVRCLNAGKDA